MKSQREEAAELIAREAGIVIEAADDGDWSGWGAPGDQIVTTYDLSPRPPMADVKAALESAGFYVESVTWTNPPQVYHVYTGPGTHDDRGYKSDGMVGDFSSTDQNPENCRRVEIREHQGGSWSTKMKSAVEGLATLKQVDYFDGGGRGTESRGV